MTTVIVDGVLHASTGPVLLGDYVVHGFEDGLPCTRTVPASSISTAQAQSRLQCPVIVHSGACPAEAGCR